MAYKHFFWLHIKKAGGITTRKLLEPYYVEVDRGKKPKSFIQAEPKEYNDILNNYRVLLGEYQFRRSLFARKFLYPGEWDNIYSFAFSREPTDRCVSMFFYLYWKNKGLFKFLRYSIRRSLKTSKLHYNTSYAFDVFLDYVQQARESNSIYRPFNNHFTTHTATVWDDVTDEAGTILLKRIYRLDDLTLAIYQVFEACGLEKRIAESNGKLNVNKNRGGFTPTKKQIQKIQRIYSHDFEIYENAGLSL